MPTEGVFAEKALDLPLEELAARLPVSVPCIKALWDKLSPPTVEAPATPCVAQRMEEAKTQLKEEIQAGLDYAATVELNF